MRLQVCALGVEAPACPPLLRGKGEDDVEPELAAGGSVPPEPVDVLLAADDHEPGLGGLVRLVGQHPTR
eukprot:2811664-Lingulodinium_polyedra.AAC.1